jgi:hypothetical protein
VSARQLTPRQREALLYFAASSRPTTAPQHLHMPSIVALVAAGLLRRSGETTRYAATEAGAVLADKMRGGA